MAGGSVQEERLETCSDRIRQRIARFHHAGGRWRTPDDRTRNRGRKGRRNLCGAEPRQAEASALGPMPMASLINRKSRFAPYVFLQRWTANSNRFGPTRAGFFPEGER